MHSLPKDYSVGDKVTVTDETLRNINVSNRCTGVQFYSEEFFNKLRKYVGKLATVTHRFRPSYEMTIRFEEDGQHFHAKDNWVRSWEITPVAEGSGLYNACDAPGHERGIYAAKPRGKNVEKKARVYSVYRIEGKMAFCESWDIMGKKYKEVFPLATLEAWGPKQRD